MKPLDYLIFMLAAMSELQQALGTNYGGHHVGGKSKYINIILAEGRALRLKYLIAQFLFYGFIEGYSHKRMKGYGGGLINSGLLGGAAAIGGGLLLKGLLLGKIKNKGIGNPTRQRLSCVDCHNIPGNLFHALFLFFVLALLY